jgi:hypothetical protein
MPNPLSPNFEQNVWSQLETYHVSNQVQVEQKLMDASPELDHEWPLSDPMKVVLSQSLVETQTQPLSLSPAGLGPEMESPVCESGSSTPGETTPDLVEPHLNGELARPFEVETEWKVLCRMNV